MDDAKVKVENKNWNWLVVQSNPYLIIVKNEWDQTGAKKI